jgi:hypothetical protein
VKRGPWLRPQASEGEAQHGPFCWIGRIGQGDRHLHCGCHGQNRAVTEGSERARSPAAGSGEPHLPLQADRTGSRASIAMAFQRACRSRPGAMFARFTLNSRHQMAAAFFWLGQSGSRSTTLISSSGAELVLQRSPTPQYDLAVTNRIASSIPFWRVLGNRHAAPATRTASSSIDEQERAASPIHQNFPPHMHIIVSRGTVDERNDGAARA